MLIKVSVLRVRYCHMKTVVQRINFIEFLIWDYLLPIVIWGFYSNLDYLILTWNRNNLRCLAFSYFKIILQYKHTFYYNMI